MFDLLAERKIAEALANGEFGDLPGAGQPLELVTIRCCPKSCASPIASSRTRATYLCASSRCSGRGLKARTTAS
jgi:hypothetical protein